jgi:hypothetical protein
MTLVNHPKESIQHSSLCVISCFCHSVNEILALLGCYTAWSGSWLPMFWDNLLVLYSRIQRQMESVVGKYSTVLANKMFKAVVSLTIFRDIPDIILIDFVACSATVTAVPLRQCYGALRKHCNIRGLAYLSDMYCCCMIMLGVILRVPSLLCWTPDVGNMAHVNSLGLPHVLQTGHTFPRLVISI